MGKRAEYDSLALSAVAFSVSALPFNSSSPPPVPPSPPPTPLASAAPLLNVIDFACALVRLARAPLPYAVLAGRT